MMECQHSLDSRDRESTLASVGRIKHSNDMRTESGMTPLFYLCSALATHAREKNDEKKYDPH
jgi:hypothetical protein